VVCLVVWVAWVVWAEWECNHSDQTQNSKRAVFTALFLPQTKTSLFILSNVKTFKNLQLLTI